MPRHNRRHKPLSRPRNNNRLRYVAIGCTAFAAIIVMRLAMLQIVNHGFYVALAEGQHAIREKLQPVRGEILFHDADNKDELYPLVTNRELRFIYAVPKNVRNPAENAKTIAEKLDLDEQEVFGRINRPDDGFEPIKHEVDVATADALLALNIEGIEASPETTRYYPYGALAGQLTGFVGYSDDQRVGQYGLEGSFEKELAGEPGTLEAETDAVGRLIAVGKRSMKEAQDGDTLVLTIDRTIQYTACKKLEETVSKHGADGGDVIIVDPTTGAILAMCSTPNFDPNRYSDVASIAQYSNGAMADQYEPGSVIKAMTMAAAIDENLVTPDSTYVDTGSEKIGSYTIRNSDYKTYGEQTMSGVLENSINTGAIHVVRLLGPDRFRSAMERFGFGEKTGVELQGESPGDITTLAKPGEIWSATGSFGQGMTATPMQLVMAYAAIANNGVLMKPYLVDETVQENGYRETTQPHEVRRVISETTARTMQAMLVNVVRKGHGKRAGVEGYFIGGKTGTAQIPYSDRPGYDPNKNIGTFIGFGPLSKPRFAMLVKIDVPKDVQFAESSAAPLFGDIASFLVHYLEIPPEEETK